MKKLIQLLIFIFTIGATVYVTRYYDDKYGDIK